MMYLDSTDDKNLQQQIRKKELNRISKEIHRLVSEETNYEFVRKLISSTVFSEKELDDMVYKHFDEILQAKRNSAITSKTIWGCLTGMICGIIIGSGSSVLLMQHFDMPLTLVVLMTYGISYLLIWLITKQNRSNALVFIAAFLGTGISLFLDFYILGTGLFG